MGILGSSVFVIMENLLIRFAGRREPARHTTSGGAGGDTPPYRVDGPRARGLGSFCRHTCAHTDAGMPGNGGMPKGLGTPLITCVPTLVHPAREESNRCSLEPRRPRETTAHARGAPRGGGGALSTNYVRPV